MSPPEPVCSVSVDVDGLAHYHRIHGLDAAAAGDEAWTVGVPRFLELFERHGILGTFFVVGEDLAAPGPARDAVTEAASRGHEIGNHTLGHRYDLVRLGPDERRREIEGGAEAIEAVTGQRPTGFRAPGYTVDLDLLRLVAETGHAYDSSVFPCPPYYAAKWGTMALMRLSGRRSASIPGSLRALFAPPVAYRPAGSPYRAAKPGEAGDPALVEVPMAVTPTLRLPVIGTSVVLFGAPWLERRLAGLRRSRPLLNLELHAVDLLGLTEDRLDPGLAAQPDLRRRSLPEKQEALDAALRSIGGHWRFDTLAKAATAFDPLGGP
jgi:peptidoglycan/xylan/chitin deacetylase (PgdA/CDA1 family)